MNRAIVASLILFAASSAPQYAFGDSEGPAPGKGGGLGDAYQESTDTALRVMATLPLAPEKKVHSRSGYAKAEFKRSSPCPANGNNKGPCPGYIIDHIKPLCADGLDDPSNMQWQTVADAKIKDRSERTLCRTIK